MSISTRACENLDKITEKLDECMKLISEIVIDKCWGYEDYDHVALLDILTKIMSIKKQIK